MFNQNYMDLVVKREFEKERTYFYEYFFITSMAQAVMLTHQGIITLEEGTSLLLALKRIRTQREDFVYDKSGKLEDFFYMLEHRLEELTGTETAGKLHIGRSRNELAIAFLRMHIKERLFELLDIVAEFMGSLLGFSEAHVETIMPAFTHARYAQPTTLGHYAMGIYNCISRDFARLRSSYSTVDQSPLGASVLTTTGFQISRDELKELACFSNMQDNSYDDIASIDYILEPIACIEVMTCTLSRFVNDLFHWCMSGVDDMQIAMEFLHGSSAMPQKRNPVVLEAIKASISEFHGHAQSLKFMAHGSHYTDASETDYYVFHPINGSFAKAKEALVLINDVVKTIEVRGERLHRKAIESFCTAMELADSIVREKGLSFRTAHSIVSSIVTKLGELGSPRDITVELLRSATKEITGKDVDYSIKFIKNALDPANFIKVREHVGSPKKEMVLESIAKKRDELMQNRQWLREVIAKWSACRRRLDDAVQELVSSRNQTSRSFHTTILDG